MKVLFLIFLCLPICVFAKTESIIEIEELSIEEMQEYVSKGYLTYEQITKIYIERIEEYNETFESVITVNENAINEAIALDKEYEETGMRSLMHGIPVLVKDNIDVIGMPTTNGSVGLLDSYPYEDAAIIAKLREAGAIFIAKANMDEFAFNAYESDSGFGTVKNAYNTSYSSYGSSGGSASGIGTSFAQVAIGTDTGVSIRVPSGVNNVVGLRPSSSIINTDGIIKYDALRDTAGPMTKYIEDASIVLEIIDETEKEYDNFTVDLTGYKIGVFSEQYYKSPSFIRDLIDIQINNLISLGAEVEFVGTLYLEYQFNDKSTCYDFNNYIKGTSSSIKSLDDLIKSGQYSQYIDYLNNSYCDFDYRQTDDYEDYLDYQQRVINNANSYFEKHEFDAVIYPTILTETFTLTEAKNPTPSTTYGSNIAPATGFPSISVQIGFENGLPYGMEVLSQIGNEDKILNIGYHLEEINNFYEVSSLTPSLYKISTDLKLLIAYYELKLSDNYDDIKEEISYFFKHYNEFENKDEEVLNLLYKFENVEALEIKYSYPQESNLLVSIGYLVIIVSTGLIMPIYYIRKKKK